MSVSELANSEGVIVSDGRYIHARIIQYLAYDVHRLPEAYYYDEVRLVREDAVQRVAISCVLATLA